MNKIFCMLDVNVATFQLEHCRGSGMHCDLPVVVR